MKNLVFLVVILFVLGCFNRTLDEELFDVPAITEEGTDISSETSSTTLIYFENGICKCPEAQAGDTEIIDEVKYTAVDNTSIGSQIKNSNFIYVPH